MKLEHRYTVPQVLYAVEKYTDTKNDIPAPADLLAILNPQKPKVTEAQYIAALEWQKRNEYPAYSDAKYTIMEYEQQKDSEKENWKCENETILKLAGNSFKRISHE